MLASRGIRYPDLIAARSFGLIKSFVGSAYQIIERIAAWNRACHSRADGDALSRPRFGMS